MRLEPAYLFHIASGSLAVLLYWATLLQRKGRPRHKRNGRWFLVSLAVLLVSIAGIFFLSRHGFSPPGVIQFSYLSICLIMVASTALMAIRLKRDLRAFGGLWFKAIGIVAFAMALVVLAAGVATRDPMPAIFSVIGLVYGGAMIRFTFMQSEAHPSWPLIWHLNGMTFLFNAVHGTLLAVAWRALVDPAGGPEVNFVTQVGTMLAALVMRFYFGWRFGAPLRLTAPRTAIAAT
jgi:hypothetical protein